MREPTDAEVAAFEKWVTERFHFQVIDKDNNAVMQIAAQFLSATKIIPDVDNFMANYATTLGEYVFMPKHWTGWLRIQALAHEAMHVYQFRAYGMAYLWLDAVQGGRRAAFEAEGYRMQFDCAWWRYGSLDLEGWRYSEGSYGLNDDDRELMDDLFLRQHAGACSGVPGTQVSAEIIDYLNQHLSDIRATS